MYLRWHSFRIVDFFFIYLLFVVYKQARKTGLSYIALEYALRAAHQLGDVDWALQLRAWAKQDNKWSTYVDRLVLHVLLAAERLGDARSVLKV